MPVEVIAGKARGSKPVHLVRQGELDRFPAEWVTWAKANGFTGEAGQFLCVPDAASGVAAALFGQGKAEDGVLSIGGLARRLPDGNWHLADQPEDPTLAAIAIGLGGYTFDRYRKPDKRAIKVAIPAGADAARVTRSVDGIRLVRDLINTPTSDMGPAQLETAVRALAKTHAAKVSVFRGEDLLKRNFPMIHAVGRAGADAPRLIDMRWGRADAPKVTLVGKGVCFDTGGLDIKPASGMLLMKKDMGGAANVLGLASMLMSAKADIRLRILIPAVENATAGNAFRPLDILHSRKGITVEIGNTDAEGRLILADALALADEEAPDLLLDMATLTGAARVALGPDVAPYFTDDEQLAADLAAASLATEDPAWRMPLWKPYKGRLMSRAADTNNVTTDGFAGAVTAALFLQRFVEKAGSWVHFDVYGWNPLEKPWSPVGGEAHAIRLLEKVILDRYGIAR